MTFAAASAVEPDGPDRWRASVEPGWDIAGNANGGYLLGIAARAMAAAAGRPDPVTVTAHYLAPASPGPVVLATHVVRSGRRFATVSASMAAGERRLLQVLGTFGDLSDADGPDLVDGGPPDLPPVEGCTTSAPGDPGAPPFRDHVDVRLHPDDAGFRMGTPSGVARIRGWIRFPGGEPIDTLGLLVVADAFPPTIFNTHLPVAWTPTVELTVHVRARPAPGWLRCSFTTRFVTGGFLEEDGEVWDSTGRLVAESRQLALVPRG